ITRNEDEPQQVVTDFIIESSIKIRHDHLSGCKLAGEFLVFAIEQCVSPEVIDRAMFRRSHKPGSRIFRDARLRPLFERSEKGILGEILGNAHVTDDSREASDKPRRFDSPNRINCTMCIGCHSYRSHHGSSPSASASCKSCYLTVDYLTVVAASRCSRH